jgi:hypothetical protein
MNLQTEATQTGTAVQAKDLTAGTRILIGVDTKKVLTATTKDGFTYLTLDLAGGKKSYRTFPATRTFRTF